MELKDYQLKVIEDLETFLEVVIEKRDMFDAFKSYWEDKGVLKQHYKNNIKGVPHVCTKVPTAGGKTFIAVNALKSVFQAFNYNQPLHPKFVVWLVPSLTILEQTVKHLSNPDHPYRQQLNTLFNGRVQIFEKADLLQGADFNVDSVKEQLSIVVMTFDSLRGRSKEVLKVYQDNGNLASFLREDQDKSVLLPDYDASALINVIRTLKPLVVVDESHNAETPLSVEMLQNLNPHFIFDLTATPRNNSNIISYVDAMALKKQNMVKLPVIVANQRNQEDVIMAALKMRHQLERHAIKEEQEAGGKYIRPIVLFQAEPKGKEDNTTFEKIKQTLLDLNIPEEQIKIKTATINELKDVELMDRDCPVRYIITINALKEGWDCPFAYVLATLANKSSIVDVTQIVGRVLRMPHVRKHKCDYLNMSYVFTSSNQFEQTLEKVIEGLNNAGFSDRDFRAKDFNLEEPPTEQTKPITPELPLEIPSVLELDDAGLNPNWQDEAEQELANDPLFNANTDKVNDDATSPTDLDELKKQALAQNQAYELEASKSSNDTPPPDLAKDMNIHKMMPQWTELVANLKLPQFFMKVTSSGFFDEDETWQKLDRANLLSEFELAKKDIDINFDTIDVEMAKVDLTKVSDHESTARFTTLNKADKERIKKAIYSQSDDGQIISIVNTLFELIDKRTYYPIADQDITTYLKRIVESFTPEQRGDCLDNSWGYVKKIKEKINSLTTDYAINVFKNGLVTNELQLQPAFVLPPNITPKENAPSLDKSLYMKEGKINPLEANAIRRIASLDNILWWHRNIDRKGVGFEINGFINHYPDFILMTKNNCLLLLETKGDHLDNSESRNKIILGKDWENQARTLKSTTSIDYRYFMAFESKKVEGAYLVDDVIKLIEKL